MLVISISLFFAAAVFAQGTTTTASTTTASTGATAKKPAVFRPTKDQIEQVQTILKEKKLYNGEADGKYNTPTRTGIKSFQKDNGLTQTGTLNRATLEKFGVELTENQKTIPVLASSFATEKTSTLSSNTGGTGGLTTGVTASKPAGGPKRPAPFRANADQIMAVQKLLKDGKMYDGEETGKLDPATRDGLKKYQEANGIKVTGTLNAVTLQKMGIALTDAQTANVAAQAAYDAAKTTKN